ncbi:MAG: hypothetical protein COB67_12895 [SAR324 cluster bacterium]|uniref:Cytochrome b561 bacterial/Ni-hydrogenase domain-containing protein n=1 Tax=SAR324 cluster bacterium TaxID=2024889 RepID=A0A2A4SQ59_9DELT|nr:MAG: hypothetical protein COB67_12895 [SAR324 cluster bacterium]
MDSTMGFRNFIQKTYATLVKRVYHWGLPLMLLLTYASAHTLRNTTVLEYVKRINLATIHNFIGLNLSLLCLVLIYDFFFRLQSRQKTFIVINGKRKVLHFQRKAWSPLLIIDIIFYSALFAICILGLVYYGIRHTEFAPMLPDRKTIQVIHELSGWSFLSLIMIKYYLTITHWYEQLVKYLREY